MCKLLLSAVVLLCSTVAVGQTIYNQNRRELNERRRINEVWDKQQRDSINSRRAPLSGKEGVKQRAREANRQRGLDKKARESNRAEVLKAVRQVRMFSLVPTHSAGG